MTIRVSKDRIDMDDKVLQKPVLKDYGETVVTANSSTAYTIDLTTGNVFNITLTGNCAFTFSNPPASGTAGSFTLTLTQDSTGTRTVTWPGAVTWLHGSTPTLQTALRKADAFEFVTLDGGTTWYGMHTGALMRGVRIYLTSGTSWTVPADWNSLDNTIEVIGGGGGGGYHNTEAGGGGGGGAYAVVHNLSLTPSSSVTYSIGGSGTGQTSGAAATAGGSTYFNGASLGASSVGAVGGGAASGITGGSGGASGSCVGATKYSGGTGGTNSADSSGSGGGGAAGPGGAGKNGADGGGNGAGGGGAGGGSSTAGSVGTGGAGPYGVGGGTGGTSGANGGAGSNGGGGGGGGDINGGTAGLGGAGGAGTEWGLYGAGGGGGGGGGTVHPSQAGHGGGGALYGGGGGGGGRTVSGTGSDGNGGAGGQGVIVITYTPGTPGSSVEDPKTLSITDGVVLLDSSDQNTYTFSSVSVPNPSADRYIVVGIIGLDPAAITDINTVTIGGGAAVTLNQWNLGQMENALYFGGFYYRALSSGSTVDVVVDLDGSGTVQSLHGAVWEFFKNTGAPSMYDVQEDYLAAGINKTASVLIDLPGELSAVLACSANTGADTHTWIGVTESGDTNDGNDSSSCGDDVFESAQTDRTVSVSKLNGDATGLQIIAINLR